MAVTRSSLKTLRKKGESGQPTGKGGKELGHVIMRSSLKSRMKTRSSRKGNSSFMKKNVKFHEVVDVVTIVTDFSESSMSIQEPSPSPSSPLFQVELKPEAEISSGAPVFEKGWLDLLVDQRTRLLKLRPEDQKQIQIQPHDS